MIAVRDKIHSELITTNSDLEILTVKIGIHFPLMLRIVYRPPNSSFDQYINLFKTTSLRIQMKIQL